MNSGTLHTRIKKLKWTLERALTTPVRPKAKATVRLPIAA
jgi:hypothetical protein